MGKDDIINPIEDGTIKPALNIIYLLDVSGSMYGERINQLNVAMPIAIQAAEDAAIENEVDLYMRIAKFSDDAEWIFGATDKGVEHIDWVPLSPIRGTNTAAAIDLAQTVMHRKYLGIRNYKPVVILITDGESNVPSETMAATQRLKASLKSTTDANKDKIIRISIGVQEANRQELEGFASVGNIEHEDGTIDEMVPFVFTVDDLDALKGLLKGVTMSSIQSSLTAGTDGEIIDVIQPYEKIDKDWED